MRLFYTPKFLKQFNKLEPSLQDEVGEKIELFKKTKNHKALKVHKLKGPLTGRYGFSVNYKIRIVFRKQKDIYYLLTIGDHDIYR